MRHWDKSLLLSLLLTILTGVGLHGLFDLWPSIITEFFAPVNESLWEHMKLLYWPYLLAGLYLTGKGRWQRAPWLASLLLVCLLMPLLGWQVHLRTGAPAAHLLLYVLLMVLAFALPDRLPVGERWTGLLSAAAIVLCGMIICWTIQPPNHPLFHDLSLSDTWIRLPCRIMPVKGFTLQA